MLLGAVATPLQNSCSFSLQLQVVALLTSEPKVRGCNIIGYRYWEPLKALGAWVFLWHILDLAKRLERGGGNVDFDCIVAGHQVTQMVELAKRLQSGVKVTSTLTAFLQVIRWGSFSRVGITC